MKTEDLATDAQINLACAQRDELFDALRLARLELTFVLESGPKRDEIQKTIGHIDEAIRKVFAMEGRKP